MELTVEILLFALFSVVCLTSAVGVVLIRDPVKGAMSLIVCFFCLACLFLLQRAELLAVLEVLVYAGAIMVLFVFVIMLVENKDQAILGPALGGRVALPMKIAGVLFVLYAFASFIGRTSFSGVAKLPKDFGTAKSIGRTFFDGFLFHFELTSVLLLVGIVGAVIVSKRGRAVMEKER